MRDWLIDILSLQVDELCVRRSGDEIISGYIRSRNEVFRVHGGVPILYPRVLHKHLKKIIIAYRKIPPNTWSVQRSDWLKYLRKQQARLILHGINHLMRNKKAKDIKILAIGCGSGWELWLVIKYLRTAYNEVRFKAVGADISLNALFEAKRISKALSLDNVDFVCVPAEFLPFKSATFDIVLAIFGALDHSIFYPHAFKEISRVIKPAGVFIGTVINRYSLDWIIKVVRSISLLSKTIKYADRPFAFIRIPTKNGFVKIPTHFYTILEIKKLLSMHGFRLTQFRSIFSMLPMNFKLRKFLRIHSVLCKFDEMLSQAPILKSIGRYLGFVAEKI
ncbi:MAG: class I SAM-dependent methyltransferase [Crenarchaeota archaeon]|nr:class I SAM-dependent methyltransferase [Thermoproteota archaeon]MCR8455349.1 class I SAM-dependent methyltransferase [Thermoproteota archaeon]MCR8470928.1 class I SAM-dependent methyltransferase [Thermoproteota archaeon]MCR8471764.1 class I SAM-dependent methyltransferase [Thermoproteota archaeon]MCR8472876.1 class I SAM-dependent methyltransferase [Thermoproteota archaeon]